MILIVEDDASLARVYSHTVTILAPVRVVGTVAEACAVYDHGRWMGAIVDISLPDGDGGDVAEYIRRRDIGAPILVATGRDDNAVRARASRLAAVYCLKPVATDVLQAFILHTYQRSLSESQFGTHLSNAIERWALSKGLTPTECEVVRLRASGLTRPQIAHQLAHTMSTLDRHAKNILKKTHSASLDDLALAILREVAGRPHQ